MILVYSGNLKAQQDQLLEHMKEFDVFPVDDSGLDMTMNELSAKAESRAEMNGKTEARQEPFLYFVGEDPEKIYALQKQLHEAGLSIYAMAVRTDNNSQWKMKDLMEEVSREAEYFRRRDHLYDLIQSADGQLMKENPKYGKSVMIAWQLLQQEELPEDLLEMAIQVLETAPVHAAASSKSEEENSQK